jgi:hypothetical protein
MLCRQPIAELLFVRILVVRQDVPEEIDLLGARVERVGELGIFRLFRRSGRL